MSSGASCSTSSRLRSNTSTALSGREVAAYARPRVAKTSGRPLGETGAMSSPDSRRSIASALRPAAAAARPRAMFARAAAAASPAWTASSRSVSSLLSASARSPLRILGVPLADGGTVAQPKLKLATRDPQLALVDLADLGTGLEVVGRDPKLLGEHPQRLDRGPPCAGLDSRDVRVRDPRARKLALREPSLLAQASQALADGLDLSLVFARHR